jgi:large subunit ribosomal protein L13
MGGKRMNSYMANAETVQRKWYVIDATDKTLGRMASQVATILRGKNKPTFTPHVDTGDFVIIINAEKIHLTGKKLEQKLYRHHSLYPGGLKEVPYKKMMETKPELVITEAVRRMLPTGKLGRQMFTKLKVFRGPVHTHEAQKPEVLELKY